MTDKHPTLLSFMQERIVPLVENQIWHHLPEKEANQHVQAVLMLVAGLVYYRQYLAKNELHNHHLVTSSKHSLLCLKEV